MATDVGGTVTFSAVALNAIGYQWQVDQGSGFTNIGDGHPYSGATTATLIIAGATAGMNGYQYRVVVTGAAEPAAVSGSATLTVNSPPAITAQPSNSTIAVGANTAFSVTASDATGYQWQVDKGVGFSNVSNGGIYSGATTATLTITGATAGMNGYLYRVVATGVASPAATSSAALLTVIPPPVITQHPFASTIAAGDAALFYVAATNTTAYQWQVNTGAGFTNISNGGPYSGATTAVLIINGATADMNGYLYRVVATGVASSDATSSAALLTVIPPPAITAQPSNSTIGAGANTSFSATASDATGYQWQVDQGAGFSDISNGGVYSGATTATLTITGATAGMNGYLYRVVATGLASPAATSDAATLTVNSPPDITGHPSNSAIVAGTDTTFSVTAENATGYQWQVNTGSGFTDISNGARYSGATTAILTITGATIAMNGDQYRVVATGLATPAATSNSATLTVSLPALTLSPTDGALTGGTTGVAYPGVTISTSGGTAPYSYAVTSGALPDGLALNATTGDISGTPTTVETASFTVTATDANGREATASYSLAVTAGEPVVPDQTVVVAGGTTPPDVRLDAGATGGPFEGAELVSVEPANAGRAEITWGDYAASGPVAPVGWYLKFTPDPAFWGEVRVRFRLINAAGSSTGIVTYTIGAAKVAEDVDSLVRGFVQSRQNMIASTIALPGLKERRRMATSAAPASARLTPSADGLTLGYATSLVQMQAAPDKSGGASAAASPFNIWVDGAFLAHRRDDSDGKWGSFAMVSLGADYLVSEKALVGLSFHYDRMTDPTDEDAELTGNGWLVGPYASFELGKDVFWDTSLLYGGSANDIGTEFWDGSFDTRRWLFDTAITGQWQLDDVTVLTPRLRAVYFSERVEDYAVENGAGDRIELDGFAQEQLRVSLGAEIARSFTLEGGSTLTPKLGATAGFSGLDGAGLFGSVSTGLSLQAVNGWAIDAALLLNLEGEGEKAVGAKLGVSSRF